jgi:hypothetical protein
VFWTLLMRFIWRSFGDYLADCGMSKSITGSQTQDY